jgi:hypothetical protein
VKKSVTPQSVTLVILKKDITARGWPRLSKTALPYVKTDFSRWTGEDDESDDMAEDGSSDTTNMGTGSSLSGIKSGGLLKQVFPLQTGFRFYAFNNNDIAKSSLLLIKHPNGSNPTSLVGATKFLN